MLNEVAFNEEMLLIELPQFGNKVLLNHGALVTQVRGFAKGTKIKQAVDDFCCRYRVFYHIQRDLKLFLGIRNIVGQVP